MESPSVIFLCCALVLGWSLGSFCADALFRLHDTALQAATLTCRASQATIDALSRTGSFLEPSVAILIDEIISLVRALNWVGQSMHVPAAYMYTLSQPRAEAVAASRMRFAASEAMGQAVQSVQHETILRAVDKHVIGLYGLLSEGLYSVARTRQCVHKVSFLRLPMLCRDCVTQHAVSGAFSKTATLGNHEMAEPI